MRPLRIFGPFPPPFGGVAIHCVRLLESLQARGINAQGVSLGGLPDSLTGVALLRPWNFFSRSPVHYHTDEGNFRWMLLLSRLWRFCGTKYVVTLHSFRHREEFKSPTTRRRLRSAYEHAEAVIAISEEVAAAVEQELGLRHRRFKVIASNLPISTWERQAPLPDEIPATWRQAEIRLLANAGAITSFEGNDLYGIDVLLDAFALISDQRVSLCIVIGGVRDKQLADRLLQQASNDARVCVVVEPKSALVPVVEQSHVVVRPTRTEGGPSLTVTEAMELGKVAIASDAVARPAGCITFRNEDPADLARVLERSIDGLRVNGMPEPHRPYSGALTQLVHLYQKLGFVENS